MVLLFSLIIRDDINKTFCDRWVKNHLSHFFLQKAIFQTSLVLQFVMHLIRHIAEVIKSEKKRIKVPVIIAPTILVAANSIPRSITEVRTVPNMPAEKTLNAGQRQLWNPLPVKKPEVRIAIAWYPTAIPNSTHKKAGVTVITAVIVRNAAIIPSIILAATDNNKQLFLQLHPKLFIKSPPIILYEK